MPTSPTDNLKAEVERLGTLDLDQLRMQFRNRTGRLAPTHLGRSLLLRVLAYRMQAEVHGDLRPETRRLLDKLGKAGGVGSEPEIKATPAVARPSRPKRGSVLVREWRGRMEHVMVLDDGYVWAGSTYPSLSAVAGAITGTKWNGPRFFGLDRQDDTARPPTLRRTSTGSNRHSRQFQATAPWRARLDGAWAKTNAGQGSFYRSQHELAPVFKKGTAPHVNNIDLGRKGRHRSNLWSYPGASSLGSDSRRGLEQHPTVKPVAMLVDAMHDVTNRGDIVLDPFLGSGSTLIAAEQSSRICRGVELDPLYVDVAVRRYQEITGDTAVLLASGETFDAVAARRSSEAQQPEASVQAADPTPAGLAPKRVRLRW